MDIFLAVLFVIICVLLIIVVLLQKGRGGGLGAAFGGAGSSAFGTKTGDVFTWVTIVLTALFLLLAVATVLVFKSGKGEVPQPVFIPSQGEIDKTTAVTFRPAAKGTQIYFTLDESEPNKNSTLFKEAIEVKPGTTVKAIAYRGGKASPVAIGRYPAHVAETGPAIEPTTGPESTARPARASAPVRPATASAPATAVAPG